MDKVISLLSSLFSLPKMASVTLPGVFAAAALAYLLRPTPPRDEVLVFDIDPVVQSEFEGCSKVIKDTTFPPTQNDRAAFAKCQPPAKPACKKADNPKTLEDTFSLAFHGRRKADRDNQKILEDQKQKLAQCMITEKSWQGVEKLKVDMANADIATLQARFTAAQQNLLDQLKTNSTLADNYRRELNRVQTEMDQKRADAIFYQQGANYRQSNLDELNRADAIISTRLAEPGRLRPAKVFDEYISGLVNHVVGFILLAIALGLVVNPISQAVTTSCFDTLFPEGF